MSPRHRIKAIRRQIRKQQKADKRARNRNSDWNDFMHEEMGNVLPFPPSRNSSVHNIVEIMTAREEVTPDWASLRTKENVAVFVYDNLKMYGKDHDLLGDAKYLGKGGTTTDIYNMKYDSEEEPVAFIKHSINPYTSLGKLHGEVYAVAPEIVRDIDFLKNAQFFRSQKHIFLRDQTCKSKNGTFNPSISCFLWLGRLS